LLGDITSGLSRRQSSYLIVLRATPIHVTPALATPKCFIPGGFSKAGPRLIGLILCVDACSARLAYILTYVHLSNFGLLCMYLWVESSHQVLLRWMGYFDDDDDDMEAHICQL